MPVVVTGATGFIGSHVARLAVARGDEVVLAVEQGSADDNLSEQAVAFSTAVLKGRLALDETGDWILAHLCRRLG